MVADSLIGAIGLSLGDDLLPSSVKLDLACTGGVKKHDDHLPQGDSDMHREAIRSDQNTAKPDQSRKLANGILAPGIDDIGFCFLENIPVALLLIRPAEKDYFGL